MQNPTRNTYSASNVEHAVAVQMITWKNTTRSVSMRVDIVPINVGKNQVIGMKAKKGIRSVMRESITTRMNIKLGNLGHLGAPEPLGVLCFSLLLRQTRTHSTIDVNPYDVTTYDVRGVPPMT